MTSKQFVIRYFGSSLLLLALIGLFNRIIDPFWYYRDTNIQGINKIKPKFRRYERYVKPALLIREQPEAIILGSSFSEIGFDPTNRFFSNNGQLRTTNFALAGADWEMVQCNFEFAINHASIKRILVGIHPGSLPTVDCQNNFATFGHISTSELLFSIRAVSSSIGTITGQKRDKPSHTKEGMYYYIRGLTGVDHQFKEFFSRRVSSNPRCSNPQSSTTSIDNTKSDNLDLSGLRKILKIAKDHNIDIQVFVYPSHAYSLELTMRCGEFDNQWQSLQAVAKLVEDESNGKQNLWHFYGYNDMTAEPIGVEPAKYWQDPEHFNYEFGDKILEDIFNEKGSHSKLGHRIISSRIDKELASLMEDRNAYLGSHSDFHDNLTKLLPSPRKSD